MRTIKTTTGAPVELDGYLLAIMEALYREVTVKRELNRSFEDMTIGGMASFAVLIAILDGISYRRKHRHSK